MTKLLLFLFVVSSLPLKAEVFETQVEQISPEPGNFGEFRLWLPSNSHPNRILVVIWGSNQCSLGIADDPAWEDFARSINCALLSCCFFTQTPGNRWDRAQEGTGDALLEAVGSLARKSGENQLLNAPFYLVGDSQGGQFAFSFSAWQPARTLGFVTLKGGQHDVAAVRTAVNVPGLFVAGGVDAPFRIANIEETFLKGRALNAPWCLAVDPQGKHDPKRCGPLVGAFLRALSEADTAEEGPPPSLVSRLGSQESVHQISSKSWFPGAAFKNAWQGFESGATAASSLSLGFQSNMPLPKATIVPPSQNLGELRSGEKTAQLSVNVSPNGVIDWDNVSVLDSPYLSDTKVVKISRNHFIVCTRLNTAKLPLGRFTGVLPLRFSSQGETILGGINVPINAIVTGDVVAIPPFIFLNTSQSSGDGLIHIKITSKTKHPIELLNYQVSSGMKLQASTTPANPLDLTIQFDNRIGEEVASGSILLHLKTEKEWLLRVPYVNSLPN